MHKMTVCKERIVHIPPTGRISLMPNSRTDNNPPIPKPEIH